MEMNNHFDASTSKLQNHWWWPVATCKTIMLLDRFTLETKWKPFDLCWGGFTCAELECWPGDGCSQRSELPLHHIHLQLREHKGPLEASVTLFLFRCTLHLQPHHGNPYNQLSLEFGGWCLEGDFVTFKLTCYLPPYSLFLLYPHTVPLSSSNSLILHLSTQTSNSNEREREKARQWSRFRMIQTCAGHGSSDEKSCRLH